MACFKLWQILLIWDLRRGRAPARTAPYKLHKCISQTGRAGARYAPYKLHKRIFQTGRAGARPLQSLLHEMKHAQKNTCKMVCRCFFDIKKLVKSTLTSGFRFLFAFYTGFIVVFPFAYLSHDSRFCAIALKTPKRHVQGLVIFNCDF